jgi:hypothetical protein
MRQRAQRIATATLDIIFGRLLQAPILSQQRRGFYRAYCASDWPANASIILMASGAGQLPSAAGFAKHGCLVPLAMTIERNDMA